MVEPDPTRADQARDQLFDFPCRFPIKAMGAAESGIQAIVVAIVSRHAPGIDATAVSVRHSSGGKWHSVTVVIEAQSRAQLDSIYQDLTAHPAVVWAL